MSNKLGYFSFLIFRSITLGEAWTTAATMSLGKLDAACCKDSLKDAPDNKLFSIRSASISTAASMTFDTFSVTCFQLNIPQQQQHREDDASGEGVGANLSIIL